MGPQGTGGAVTPPVNDPVIVTLIVMALALCFGVGYLLGTMAGLAREVDPSDRPRE